MCQSEIRKENKHAGSGKCFCFPHSGVIAREASKAAKGFALRGRGRGYSDFIAQVVGRALFHVLCHNHWVPAELSHSEHTMETMEKGP